MNREAALDILDEFVESVNLKRHMFAVEAAMRDYAVRYGGDAEQWGLAGLLHDFDWEIHPTLDQHPQAGGPILRSRRVPEEVIQCILSHADHTQVPRDTAMKKALYACDELTGLVIAVALVRPSRSLQDLKVKSVKKKWKDARFASNIDRGAIESACEDLDVDLWTHVGNVIESMRKVQDRLGLSG